MSKKGRDKKVPLYKSGFLPSALGEEDLISYLLFSPLIVLEGVPASLLLLLSVIFFVDKGYTSAWSALVISLWYYLCILLISRHSIIHYLVSNKPLLRIILKLFFNIVLAAFPFVLSFLKLERIFKNGISSITLICCIIEAITCIVLIAFFIIAKRNGKNETLITDDSHVANSFSNLYNANHVLTKIDNLTQFRDNSHAGIAFEAIVCKILTANGFYNVKNTRASGDYGVDVLATKNNMTYAIQCKCYKGAVPNKAVQEVFSGRAIYNCNYAVVVSNSSFTKQAIETARATQVVLWDRNVLFRMACALNQEDMKYIVTQL